MSIDEIKARSRKALHLAMQRPCYYYDPKTLLPVPLNIRVHTKQDAKGEVQGTSFRFAQIREETPSIVFLMEELATLGITPARLGVVMLTADEGYRLDNDEPVYRQTKTWFVKPLSDLDLKLYRSPKDGRVAMIRIDLPGLTGELAEHLPPMTVTGTAVQFQLAQIDIVLPPVE